MYIVANDWLYAIFSSNAEIAKTKPVLVESLNYWRLTQADQQFCEFLLELIRSGVFFSDSLVMPFSGLLSALFIIERDASAEDYISTLLHVVANNYFSYPHLVVLLKRLNEVTSIREKSDHVYRTSKGEHVQIDIETWKEVATANQSLLDPGRLLGMQRFQLLPLGAGAMTRPG